MSIRRLAAAAVVLAAAAALAGFIRFFGEAEERLDPKDLERRTMLSRPDWHNYDEDVKAQIGAAPVAQWKGRLISAQRDETFVNVTFEISGVWAERTAVMPVIVRDPAGKDRRYVTYKIEPPRVTYTYQIAERAETPVPWILVKYPHHEDRITLDADGAWSAP